MNKVISHFIFLLIAVGFSNISSASKYFPSEDQHFAAPFSGKKVEKYDVSLPIARKQLKTFEVPTDCAELIVRYKRGAFQWGNRVQRSIWTKVDTDCHYYDFLHRFPDKPANDFVSQYDFYNADFNDLPIRQSCSTLARVTSCIPMSDGIRSLGNFIPFLKSISDSDQKLSDQCQFKDGLFRGHLLLTQEGIRCLPDADAPGTRIISVDYADLNGDGFKDVILKIVPLGRARKRSFMILPLTRTAEDQKFSFPNGVIMSEAYH